jgi:hypothetical protein
MKNTPSDTSHETMIPHEHELSIPIDHAEDPRVHIPEEDDTIVTRKSKRQRVAKSFGRTLWKTHQLPSVRHIPLLMLTYGRKQ